MKTPIDVKNILAKLSASDNDIKIRKLVISGTNVYILFIAQLTDKQRLAEEVIKPLVLCREKNVSSELLLGSVIYNEEVYTDTSEDGIHGYILNGQAVLIVESDPTYLIINTYKVEKRSVPQPELETTLRGSKDAFTESIETNLSLIRYRIRDKALAIDKFNVGRRSKTSIAVLYLKDVANSEYVNEIAKRLQAIDIDGVIDSGYVQKLLTDGSTLFPQMGIVERSDVACDNILEGKIIIVIDGNNLSLVAPKVFIEYFDSGEDHYSSPHLSVFSKIIRLTALIFALCLSSLYVSVIAFNTDILPTAYIVTIATARASVPFNAVVEAFVMEFTAEIMKEASIRLPKQIGPAIGIVGTIVIGQAAVAAGLVSPLMVIFVALATMSSFVAPDYTIMSPIRIIKFFVLILTGIFGIFGFAIGLVFILVHIISIESFGVPYLAPASPLHFRDIVDYFLSDILKDKTRPQFLRTNNRTRRR